MSNCNKQIAAPIHPRQRAECWTKPNDRRSAGAHSRGSSHAFSIQHLRYATAGEDRGNFCRAAEALLLRQSTLSRCIRQLEESIGMNVFERSSGGVRVTPTGQEFLRTARSILEQVDALLRIAQSTGRGEAGRMAIGFYTSLSAGSFCVSLMDIGQHFPQIEIEMIESSRSGLATALRNGVVEIAIVPGAISLPECNTTALWSERIMVAIPEGHPFIGRDATYWTDLRDEKLLISRRDPGPECQDLPIAKLGSPGIDPRSLSMTCPAEVSRALSERDLGSRC